VRAALHRLADRLKLEAVCVGDLLDLYFEVLPRGDAEHVKVKLGLGPAPAPKLDHHRVGSELDDQGNRRIELDARLIHPTCAQLTLLRFD
jgi:hypothetical protein